MLDDRPPVSTKLKYDFVTAVCEQMKIHLGIIIELCEQMLAGSSAPVAEIQGKDIEIIRNSTRHLLGLLTQSRDEWSQNLIDSFDFTDKVNGQGYENEYEREIDSLKSDFLSTPSLELRTPVNSIIGFANVILKGVDGPITQTQEYALVKICEHGQSLWQEVNNLLDVFKFEAKKVEYFTEPLNLDLVVQHTRAKSGNSLEVEFLPAEIPFVWVDEIRLQYAIFSVISLLDENVVQNKLTMSVYPANEQVVINLSRKGFMLNNQVLEEIERVRAGGTLFACRRIDDALGLCLARAWLENFGADLTVGNQTDGAFATITLPICEE